ncbi:PREDICTED: BSD domain-containing protein 1-like [Camelina sativa]|uniref:BSD domain-containing protein 1-like n=1 Tax=Camelina sativa TaxID=90675 RepID=A0ABM0X7M5_CAMSA|nr:PREDICTED: BSD domain-containing protein 1-like [Camelina sativa]
MNFFKSVFQDDPDPPGTESESDSPKHSEEHEQTEQSNPEDDGGWSFGGLMKTLATRSESVIETYRRDLEEFGTGLKKEIEVAQGSLGTVGHAIDELGNTVLKGTADIIAQGKEAILAAGNESDSSDNNSSQSFGRRDSFSSKPYSRFDAQIRVVQGDPNTYCEEPEDSDDYKKWESGFSLDEKAEEMEKLFEDNGDMKGVYKRAVPNTVDHETFWFRYFYKVHKLKQAEDLRANLVKRAISLDDEEELSWDIDDEDESSEKDVEATKEVSRLKLEGNDGIMGSGDVSETVKDEVTNADSVAKVSTQDEVTTSADSVDGVTEVSNVALKTDKDYEEKKETNNEEVPEAKPVVAAAAPPAYDEAPIQDSVKPKSDEAAPSQEPTKPDVAAASSAAQQPSEEDLGWDEIEDMSSIDGKEVSRSGGSPNRAELRKRLSAAEDDEDLSWDIEDDEEESSSTKA